MRNGLSVMILALGLSCLSITGVEAATPPNIVIILADDLGWSDTGSYGNDFIDTPSIDALANQGMKLTRFYANPVCSPTRAAIQTGQYAARTGITDFINSPVLTGPDADLYIRGHWRPFEKVDTPLTRRALPDQLTLADSLSQAGYHTGYFGKWHLGFESGDMPQDHGYQVSQVYEGHYDDEGRPTLDLMLTDAEKFLSEDSDQPFLLFLAPTQVHIPLKADQQLVDKYRDRSEQRQRSIPVPTYAAMVEELDHFVGAVDQLLIQRQLQNSTLFIFLSDNGGLENFDLDMGGKVTSNLPLRGEKGTLYEGGIRVPFIARWPENIPEGTSSAVLTAVYDLYPTLIAASGSDIDQSALDGINLLPWLSGQEQAESANERTLYFHYPYYHHDRPATTLVTSDWKLIRFYDGGPTELYRLNIDVMEQNNVAQENPELLTKLNSQLDQWLINTNASMPVDNPNYDPQRAQEWWQPFTNTPVDIDFLRSIFKPGI